MTLILKHFLLLCVSLVLSGVALAERPQIEWARTYGNPAGEEVCTCAIQSANGSVLCTGNIWDPGTGSLDAFLVCIDANGDSLWCHTYGGPGAESAGRIIQTPDLGYLLSASTSPNGIEEEEYIWLIKTNAEGDTEWTRTYDEGEVFQEFGVIASTSDGGYILAGERISLDMTRDDALLMKLDPFGNREWSSSFSGDSAGGFSSVVQTADGGYLMSGAVQINDQSLWGGWAMKTNADGDSLWGHRYHADTQSQVVAARQTPDGGYILAESANRAMWLIKLDTSGATSWERSYYFPGTLTDAACRSMIALPDSGFLLAGFAFSISPHTSHDMYIVRTDAIGDSLWTMTIGDTALWEECMTATRCQDNGFVFSGLAGAGPGGFHIMVVKTTPEFHSAVTPETPLRPATFTLSNFPNPFNPSTWISFDLPQAGNVSLKVFDVLGREVSTLSTTAMAAGAHYVLFNGEGLASGTYVVRLEAGHEARTVKILLLK